MVWNLWRTASRWSKPFRKPKSVRLLEHSSLRRKVANFSYCRSIPPRTRTTASLTESHGGCHGRVHQAVRRILFSTETGDAWLLDPSEQLAAQLAHDGDPE